jgi:hypothetical protein
MTDKATTVDPLRICPHIEVRRQLNGANPRYYNEIWKCSDCGKEFDALLDFGSKGKIQVIAPHATMRDQFAMAALQALAINSERDETFTEAAQLCYRMADAMLKARGSK